MMSDSVVIALITGVVTVIGGLITLYTKRIEVKPETRLTTENVRDLETNRVVENSSTIGALQGYVEFLTKEMNSLKDKISKIEEEHRKDTERLNLVMKANYWHRAYEKALLDHINSGKKPPPPSKPAELEFLYTELGINVYEERNLYENKQLPSY